MKYSSKMINASKMTMLPLAFAAAVTGVGAKEARPAQRPNIILIYVDDMGYSDVSAYGGRFVQTPNIDQIGKDGIRFTQYYTSCPISSPSRTGVTTGMYPTKWGITTFLNDKKTNLKNESNNYLLPDAPSLARAMKAGGYATGHFGKWHMGGGRDVKDAPLISRYGFDEYVSTWESPDPDPAITSGNWIWQDTDSIKRWHRTEYFVDKTLDFLKRHPDTPCYINLWPDDMHTPYVPSQEAYAQGEKDNGYWEQEENFTPVLKELDKQIGRLMAGLKDLGIDDNTIVIFTSDNGPNPSYKNARTAGLRGQKATNYEGGIRMPFMIRWPAVIKPGQVNNTSVLCSVDLYPSLCKIAGVNVNSGQYTLDGIDFSKTLTGMKVQKRTTPLYWEFGKQFVGKKAPQNAYQTRSPNVCVRDGDWKLIINYDGTSPELYNLAQDINETTNVADKYPKITRKLTKKALNWFNASFREFAGNLQ
jgi:arylsulfatase A-like enzyme